jgi:hypothetical protein
MYYDREDGWIDCRGASVGIPIIAAVVIAGFILLHIFGTLPFEDTPGVSAAKPTIVASSIDNGWFELELLKTLPVLTEIDGVSVIGKLYKCQDNSQPDASLYALYWAIHNDSRTVENSVKSPVEGETYALSFNCALWGAADDGGMVELPLEVGAYSGVQSVALTIDNLDEVSFVFTGYATPSGSTKSVGWFPAVARIEIPLSDGVVVLKQS